MTKATVFDELTDYRPEEVGGAIEPVVACWRGLIRAEMAIGLLEEDVRSLIANHPQASIVKSISSPNREAVASFGAFLNFPPSAMTTLFSRIYWLSNMFLCSLVGFGEELHSET